MFILLDVSQQNFVGEGAASVAIRRGGIFFGSGLCYRRLFPIAQGNQDHGIAVGIFSTHAANVFSCGGWANNIICDSVKWTSGWINLLQKAFKDVQHDACPVIGMAITLKRSLSKQITVTGHKITLVLNGILRPQNAGIFTSGT